MGRRMVNLCTRRLEEELNSEAFVSGIEAAIKFASDTGKEAGFFISYYPEIGIFGYPDHINTCDGYPLLPSKRTRRRRNIFFRLLTGLTNPSEGIEYPQSGDYRMKKDAEEELSVEPCTYNYSKIDAILVRVEPTKSLVPFAIDLQSLNASRRKPNSLFYRANPIMIIASPKKILRAQEKGYFPFFVLQENRETPLPRKTDFRIMPDKIRKIENLWKRGVLGISRKYFVSEVEERYNIQYSGFYIGYVGRTRLDKLLPVVK